MESRTWIQGQPRLECHPLIASRSLHRLVLYFATLRGIGEAKLPLSAVPEFFGLLGLAAWLAGAGPAPEGFQVANKLERVRSAWNACARPGAPGISASAGRKANQSIPADSPACWRNNSLTASQAMPPPLSMPSILIITSIKKSSRTGVKLSASRPTS